MLYYQMIGYQKDQGCKNACILLVPYGVFLTFLQGFRKKLIKMREKKQMKYNLYKC